MEKTKTRILVADDVCENLRLIGRILKNRGFDARLVPGGEQALISAKIDPPDLIILDVKMPEMDGYRVCRRIKSDPALKDVPVIFISALHGTPDMLKGLSSGGVDYIAKPFDEQEIVARVETHLRLRSLQTDLEKRNAELTAVNEKLRAEVAERRRAEVAIRDSEVRFRRLVEHGADPILVQNSSGKILMVNKLACMTLGYSRPELLSMNMSRIHGSPENRPDPKGVWTQVPPDNPLLMETAYLKKDGSTLPVEVRMVRVRLENENVIVNFARDIQDRKQRERERLRIEKLESLSVLSGGIAHDFNNLLFIVSGNADLLEDLAGRDPAAGECLREIKSAVSRAKELTHRLITFAAGDTPVKRTVSVADLIRDCIRRVGADDRVRCEVDMPERPWPAQIDEAQIKRVLESLLTNAREAMPGGGTIHVKAENLFLRARTVRHGQNLPAGKYVTISIRDEGPGISEKNLSSVFDPYFTTKEKGARKGLGLGLAVAYAIVKKHGGCIAVESRAGATFTIYIPTGRHKPRETASMPEEKNTGPRERKKLLVMDDEKMVGNMLRKQLNRMGFDAEIASDGDEALVFYKRAMNAGAPFDAAILDLSVKNGMDGRETMEILLDIDPNVKAIISSGFYDDPVMSGCNAYGFCDAIKKPYEIETLRKVLHRVLSQGDE